MRRILSGTFLLCIGAAQSAAAQYCHDLWFSRNAMWNDVGYCFSSPLGQAVFDNSDCTTEAPVLSELNTRIVARIVEVEDAFACEVDTSATSLDDAQIFSLEYRRAVTSQPVLGRSEFTEWSCDRFQQPRRPVLAAPEAEAEILGWIETGDGFSVNHDTWDGWDFVTVTEVSDEPWQGVPKAAGWVWLADLPEVEDYTEICLFMAG
ncbi:DUF4453 domain-containing protein [Aestuariibius sp. 2305UL40-4]|uniref:DUF4453 domain-containing protein n=1 Tax=Aestuariibius violaceus TaxID=3234132 RepID=UPI00345E38FF